MVNNYDQITFVHKHFFMFVIIDREQKQLICGTICTDRLEATKLGKRNLNSPLCFLQLQES